MALTDKLAAFSVATKDQLLDGEEWLIHAVETHETLAQFEESATKWVARSATQRGEIAGFPFIAWNTCQAVKGQPRRSLSVVDFGDVRYAIESDLTNYL